MTIRAALAAWHYIFGFGVSREAAASRTVGGSATPAACKARLANRTNISKSENADIHISSS
jgi:hypothetical protein